MVQRAALYIKLGFPAPGWLVSLLPPVDLKTMAAAKKLAAPLRIDRGPLYTIRSRYLRVGNAIYKLLMIGGVMVLGCIVIKYLIQFGLYLAKQRN